MRDWLEELVGISNRYSQESYILSENDKLFVELRDLTMELIHFEKSQRELITNIKDSCNEGLISVCSDTFHKEAYQDILDLIGEE